MSHVHTDLVSPAGLERAGKASDIPTLGAIPRFRSIVRDRLAAILAHPLLQPVVGIAPERRLDRGAGTLGHPPDEGGIVPVQRAGATMVGKLRSKMLVRLVGL